MKKAPAAWLSVNSSTLPRSMPVVAATHLALSAAQVRKPCTSKDAVFGKVKRQLIFVPWLMAAISAYCSISVAGVQNRISRFRNRLMSPRIRKAAI